MSTVLNLSGKKIYIAGHQGMVGRALVRRLADEHCEIITVNKDSVDLCDQNAVNIWMKQHKPHIVILAAAKVGGIYANDKYPVDFLYNNLMIESNVIHAAYINNIEKLLFLGSSCIYPRDARQPIKESALLTGALEPTNQWYAIAKIAGLKLVEAYKKQYNCNFISCMPTNLYGSFDNYDLKNSHVLPALLRKIHEAKQANLQQVSIWGTGKVKREFLYVDDLADACVHLIKHYSGSIPVNIGVGKDITISELAEKIATVVGYNGNFAYDHNMPDGTPQKLLDTSLINSLGWQPSTNLIEGIKYCYQDYLRRIN